MQRVTVCLIGLLALFGGLVYYPGRTTVVAVTPSASIPSVRPTQTIRGVPLREVSRQFDGPAAGGPAERHAEAERGDDSTPPRRGLPVSPGHAEPAIPHSLSLQPHQVPDLDHPLLRRLPYAPPLTSLAPSATANSPADVTPPTTPVAAPPTDVSPDEDLLLDDPESPVPSTTDAAVSASPNQAGSPGTKPRDGEQDGPADAQQEGDASRAGNNADEDADDENAAEKAGDQTSRAAEDPHWKVFAKNQYPSAKECRTCHEKIYEEWAVSSHAYAYVSPMFHKFEQSITDLTRGTIGYFCVRCHSPVGVTVCQSRHDPVWDSIPAAKEGITCVACHRVKERYGRVNGERRIEPGDLFQPVYGAGNGEGLNEVLAKKGDYKVKTSPDDKGPGQAVHQRVIQFEQISASSFCASCHQVAVYPGIKLEVVWEQYRASPACKKGVSCQDCHMGKVPGVACGYDSAPKAIVADKPISPHSKHANHTFYGPGYSIAHPGIFPFHKDGDRWTMQEWLLFDHRAGWGTDAFEKQIENKELSVTFPKVWAELDDRIDAREIVDANLKRLADKRELRRQVMENGSHVDGPFFTQPPQIGAPLRFHYVVSNRSEGHNFPTASLGAQPQLWLNVVLTAPHGEKIWESGYVDANGDVADLHSLEVAAGHIRHDNQLFNLQTKFLTTNVKGTEREMCLPINVDVDQLPYIRPSGLPITVLNHPPFIRMEAHSLAALGSRAARYVVPSECIRQPGKYRLSARMRSRAEPVYFMRFCRATPEMEQGMNEGVLDFHEQAVEFIVR